jgi:hypothetical protein
MQFDVISTGTPPPMLPANGFWTDPRRPGTGLFLQQRGDLIAVSQFDYVDGVAHWRLDAAPLQGSALLLVLRNYEGGSCLACEPHVAPDVGPGGTVLRMRFESARRAYVDFADGSTQHLISLPFGASYLDLALADRADADFAPLPLPDLSGHWYVNGSGIVLERNPDPGTAAVRFSTVASSTDFRASIRCVAGSSTQFASCTLDTNTPSLSVPRLAPLGFVEEDRIRFLYAGLVFYMVRVPPTALPPYL